jgi:lipoprotein-anchoring transpeptidase ErfK/SrfK
MLARASAWRSYMDSYKSPNLVRAAVAGLLALSVIVGPGMTAVALAAGRGTITRDVIFAGANLKGSSESSATAFIVAHAARLPRRMPVVAGGKSFGFDPRGSYAVDMAKTLDQAYAAGDATVTLSPKYVADWTKIKAWVGVVSKQANHSAVDAHYYVTKRRLLGVAKQVDGAAVLIKDSTNLVAKTVVWEAETGLRPDHALALPIKAAGAKITLKQGLGKAIIVVLGKRRLWLYSGSKIQATYGVAVGQAAYPTPLGIWKIIDKNPAPSWNNPGSDWAKNMPSHIGPGSSNPLGLRALYLNADGIRIHGTQNTGSIGTPASHGCIRVANSNIVKLYPLVPIGTTVFIVK